MDRIRCIYLEPTEFHRVSLRRYYSKYAGVEYVECPQKCTVGTYHDASVVIVDSIQLLPDQTASMNSTSDRSDPNWPTKCACGYEFKEDDTWQRNVVGLYKRSDNGELVTLHQAPVGAIWDAAWYPDAWKNVDGHCYICLLPGGHHWNIDGKASNCTRPGEKHDCWVRHGTPPDLHVDKNGNTCNAGGGSILTQAGWHGFLRNGWLEQC